MKKTHKTFVIGDIHGGYKSLMQVLGRAKFDYKKDTLICLGDVADGWPEVAECFEELLKIEHLVFVRGNHDQWLLDYLRFEDTPDIWIRQGGQNSFLSYQKHLELKEKHRDFLMSTPFHYIDEKKRLYVHGGLSPGQNPETMSPEDLMWSRELWRLAGQGSVHVPGFKEVYVGHTSIWRFSVVPHQSGNVIFMDAGGGWEGKLSVMDVNSKEVFQSDIVSGLYPELCKRCHGSGCPQCELCGRCNGNGCPACDGTKGSKYNPDGY